MSNHPDKELIEGEWFACDYPERPDEYGATIYVQDCPKCLMAAEATLRLWGDRVGQSPSYEFPIGNKGRLSDWIASQKRRAKMYDS